MTETDLSKANNHNIEYSILGNGSSTSTDAFDLAMTNAKETVYVNCCLLNATVTLATCGLGVSSGWIIISAIYDVFWVALPLGQLCWKLHSLVRLALSLWRLRRRLRDAPWAGDQRERDGNTNDIAGSLRSNKSVGCIQMVCPRLQSEPTQRMLLQPTMSTEKASSMRMDKSPDRCIWLSSSFSQ